MFGRLSFQRRDSDNVPCGADDPFAETCAVAVLAAPLSMQGKGQILESNPPGTERTCQRGQAMKIIVKVVLVLILLGYFAYGWQERQTRARYGISFQQPLGEFEKLDHFLAHDLGMAKSRLPQANSSYLHPTEQAYRYGDSRNQYEYVVLLVDESGMLQSIAAWYITLPSGTSQSPVGTFMEDHWSRCGGPDRPRFAEFSLVGSSQGQATFRNGRVKGRWKKIDRDYGLVPEPTHEHVYLQVVG